MPATINEMIELGIIVLFAVAIFTIFTRSINIFRKNIKEGNLCQYYQCHKLELGNINIIDGNNITVENIVTRKIIVVKRTDLYPLGW